LNIVLQQSWQMYAVAVIVGFATELAGPHLRGERLVGMLDEVTKAVGETRNAAGQVLKASETVEAAASRLQRGIEGFLGRVASDQPRASPSLP